MSTLLQKAFAEAAKLSQEDQDLLAAGLLDELAAEEAFDQKIAATAHRLVDLANAALAEHEAGLTEELDPDRL